jgi:capsular exopolysaccharide synthesis family protein
MNVPQVIALRPDNETMPSTQALVPVPDRVDLRSSLSFIARRRWLIALVALATLAIGFVLTYLQPRIFSATSAVTLEGPAEGGSDSNNPLVPTNPSLNSAFVDTQVEIIKSREMAERVASQIGLLDGKSARERAKVVSQTQWNVSPQRKGASYALEITYNTNSPEQAAAAANEFAKQLTTWEMRASRERSRSSIQLVGARLDQLRRAAHADSEALQRYRIAHNLLSTSGASLTEQEISSYNQAVSNARAEAAEDEARLNTAQAQLSSGSSGDDIGEALGSSVVSSLRSREAQLAGEVANLESRYGPNHPQLLRSQAELGEVRAQIKAEIGRVVSNLEAKRDVSRQRLGSLSSSLSGAQSQLTRSNVAMVGLDELQRKAEASKAIYDTYLNSYKQLVAQEGSERPNARILSLADVPMLPSSPNWPLNLVLSLLIGVGVGIVVASIAEAVFSGIASPYDVEGTLQARWLGSIPLLSSVSSMRGTVEAVRDEPRSAFAEAFRSLCTSIDQAADRQPQVFAVSSALPQEGKTTVSACLAHTLAMSGGRTVLVDCDLARRGTSRLLQVDPGRPGLVEVIEGKAPLVDALVPVFGALSVLPIRASDSHPEPILTGRIFAALMQELRAQFDYVVLDLPPVLPVAAARTVASHADATVMVVRWRKTSEAAVRSALRRLPAEHVNLVGVVLNQVDMSRRHLIGKSDPAFFYKSYKQYYL